MSTITLDRDELHALMREAATIGAKIGVEQALEDLVCYHYKDACKRLNICYNTLQKRILEGKIRPLDGRITGAEIRRYLSQQTSDFRR